MEPKRRRLQYTVESLKNAVEEIKAGMPFKTASKKYGIPRGTLRDKVKGRTPVE
jgi:hypothetical protein